MKARKCECCGAPLNGLKCEFCGTEYAEEESLSIDHAEIEGDGFNVKIEGLKKTSSFLNGDFKKLENWEI